MQKNYDGQSHAKWLTSSWSWHQPLLGNNGVRTKRASVLIGNHQLAGAAQIKRVSVPNGDHRVPGIHRSHGSEE